MPAATQQCITPPHCIFSESLL